MDLPLLQDYVPDLVLHASDLPIGLHVPDLNIGLHVPDTLIGLKVPVH